MHHEGFGFGGAGGLLLGAMLTVLVALVALVAMPGPSAARETILAEPPPLSDEPAFIIGTRMLDLEGNIRRIGDEDAVRPVALVFLDTYCSLSGRYLPELNSMAGAPRDAEVEFYGVFSDPTLAWDDIRQMRDAYEPTFPILFDV